MNENIICVCGNAVNKGIHLCDVCGMGLPEIELKQPKADIGEMILDFWEKEFISEMKEEHDAFIKLSELF
jgi:hypothetical protein